MENRVLAIIIFLLAFFNATGQKPNLMVPQPHGSDIISSTFSSDEKFLITLDEGGVAKLWDTNSGYLLHNFKESIRIANFNPSKNQLLIINAQSIRVIDLYSLKVLFQINAREKHSDLFACFNQTGNMISTITGDSIVKVWKTDGWDLYREFKGHRKLVNAVAFSDNNNYIVTGSEDSTSRLWNIKKSKIIHLVDSSKNSAKKLLTGDFRSGLLLLDFNAFILENAGENPETIKSVFFICNDNYIISKNFLGVFDIHQTYTGKLISNNFIKETLSLKNITKHTFNPKAENFIFQNDDGTLCNYFFRNGAKITIPGPIPKILNSQYSEDGKFFVVSCQDSSIRIFDSNSLKEKLKFFNTSETNIIKISPRNQFLLSTSGKKNQELKLWDMRSGELKQNLQLDLQPLNIRTIFNKKGDLFATINIDKQQAEFVYINVISVLTGKKILSIQSHDPKSIEFESNSNNLIVTDINDIKVWNIDEKKYVYSLDYSLKKYPPSNFLDRNFSFSPKIRSVLSLDDNFILSISEKQLQIINTFRGKVINYINVFTSDKYRKLQNTANGDDIIANTKFTDAVLSLDNKFIFASTQNSIRVYNVKTGTLVSEQYFYCSIGDLKLSPAGNYLLLTGHSSDGLFETCFESELYHIDSNNLIPVNHIYRDLGYSFDREEFSADGKYIAFITNGKCELVDGKSGDPLPGFSIVLENGDLFVDAHFSKNYTSLILSSVNGNFYIYNLINNKLSKIVNGHNNLITSFAIDSKTDKIISASADQTAKLWSLPGMALISTFILFNKDDSDNVFCLLPNGDFQTSKYQPKSIYYIDENYRIIEPYQLDIKFNRPDRVLTALGNTDTALIGAYRKAYFKRVKRLDLDTLTLNDNVPYADFLNRNKIRKTTRSPKLKLRVQGIDRISFLDQFNIIINGVPLFGLRGKSIRSHNCKFFDTTINVNLSAGDNKIETSFKNINGTESYHIPLYVNYTPNKLVDTLMHFIGIGIDHFADNKYDLKWSVKDIHDLALKFKQKYGDKCQVDTLFDEHVTIDNVVALKKKLLKTGVNDKVVIAYSGHGLLSKDYDYYLSGYNVNFDKPEQGGIPYDALENLVDSIPARKKLMLIDACNSGEVDKEELARYNFAEAELDSTGVHKGVKMLVNSNYKTGMKNSFELMKELFVNVGKSTGATIISAAGGTQFALEKGDLTNGVFTFSILEYLRQPHCSISSLKKYVNKRVVELTAGMQAPTTRNDTDVVDWQVW